MKKEINDTIIIIPARYNSSRFPGKCLEKIDGKEMILRVYEQCLKCKEYYDNIDVVVAIDHIQTQNFCINNKIDFIITDRNNITGTDRVVEAFNIISKNTKYEYKNIVNVQGDEPFVNPEDIIKIIEEFEDKHLGVVCGMTEIKTEEEFFDPNIIKVLFNKLFVFGNMNPNINKLIYASRSPIPSNKSGTFTKAYKQVCIYCFSPEALKTFNNEKSKLEEIEDIEILRFLENTNYHIGLLELYNNYISVDIPEDIIKAEDYILKSRIDDEINKFLKKVEDGTNTIAIDFDGVIHANSKSFYDGTIYDVPVIGVESALNSIIEMGYVITIYTCKADPKRPLIEGKTGKELIWNWLKRYNLDKYINDVVFEKVQAKLYIDDKGYRFDNWGSTIGFLKKL